MTEQDTNSFASALYGAILARGLTLDRIAHRLGEQGFALSTATLSYWSRGRSQPERPESLAALTALEEILDVPADSLRGLLVGRVRKSRSRPDRTVPFHDLWGDLGDQVDQVISQVGLTTEHGKEPGAHERYRVISFHERYTIGADGSERHCRVIMVIEAIVEHVDRTIAVYRDDTSGEFLPKITMTSGARLGRVRQDTSSHMLVAEMYVDEVLRKGDRTAIEYELGYAPGGNRSVMCERRFRSVIRQYVLEVEFDPSAVPAICEAVAEPADGREPTARPMAIGASHAVRMVLLDQPAGAYRIHWEWE